MADDEIEAVAREGVVRASQTFDAARGASFATFAGTWIRSFVGHAVDRLRHRQRQGDRAFGGEEAVEGRTGFLDTVEARGETDPAVLAEPADAAAKAAAARVLATLDDEAREVVVLRFGIGGDRPLALHEVAKRLAFGERRVKQIEERAMETLRAAVPGIADLGDVFED